MILNDRIRSRCIHDRELREALPSDRYNLSDTVPGADPSLRSEDQFLNTPRVHGPGATSQTSSRTNALTKLLLPTFTSPTITRRAADWRFVELGPRIWVPSWSRNARPADKARLEQGPQRLRIAAAIRDPNVVRQRRTQVVWVHMALFQLAHGSPIISLGWTLPIRFFKN